MSSSPLPDSPYRGKSNISKYIDSKIGIDGGFLVDRLVSILASGSSVLELGMGPGKDLALLSKTFGVVGSDNSPDFLTAFRTQNNTIELLELDAATIQTDRKFDCVYSNKVLHHLSDEQLIESLRRQKKILNTNGIAFHSFWNGDEDVEIDGLRFKKYLPESIRELFSGFGDVLLVEEYEELCRSDSFFIAARI